MSIIVSVKFENVELYAETLFKLVWAQPAASLSYAAEKKSHYHAYWLNLSHSQQAVNWALVPMKRSYARATIVTTQAMWLKIILSSQQKDDVTSPGWLIH